MWQMNSFRVGPLLVSAGGLAKQSVAYQHWGATFALYYAVRQQRCGIAGQCFGIFRQVYEISKWHRDKGTLHAATSSDKNSIEFAVLSVTVTVSDSCSSRCAEVVRWTPYCGGESALESFRATPIPSPYTKVVIEFFS